MPRRKIHRWVLLFFLLCVSPAACATADGIYIKEWDVPTPNSLPHDPAPAPDGSLWYTGMQSDTIGRLDPRTGEIKEYPLRTGSGPHGLVADKEGTIWFTANYKGYIGKLNPRTGEVTEFKMPDPAASDPHTPVFDQTGMLWFTVQAGNFIGRLDPHTGIVTLKKLPTSGSRPYGIAVNSQGRPFFCEFGSNKIGSINPDMSEITEYPLPEGARPRRLAVTPDDMVYYTDYARGYIGRLDIRTGKVEEWASPGGKESKPYAIAAAPDEALWFSESGVMPNTLVRFDPITKRFTKRAVPSGGKVIRNMAATPAGDIFFAGSGANKVGIVRKGTQDRR